MIRRARPAPAAARATPARQLLLLRIRSIGCEGKHAERRNNSEKLTAVQRHPNSSIYSENPSLSIFYSIQRFLGRRPACWPLTTLISSM